MKKLKRLTIAGLANKVATRLQLLRRMQEADEDGYCTCITCGDVRHYKEMQGGHFMERGRMNTRLEPLNIWPQCPGCNLFGMKKASVVIEYARALESKQIGLASLLKDLSRQERKYTRIELEEMLDNVNSEIQKTEAGIRSHTRS